MEIDPHKYAMDILEKRRKERKEYTQREIERDPMYQLERELEQAIARAEKAETQIKEMRSCENCSGKKCEIFDLNSSIEYPKSLECMENDMKFWEWNRVE